MKNLKVYDRSLTNEEIQDIYNNSQFTCDGDLLDSNELNKFFCKKCGKIQYGFNDGYCSNKNWERDIRNNKINDLLK